MSGGQIGRLDGVPVTIKDLVLMRGLSDPARIAPRRSEPGLSEDAPAPARLREAGAIIPRQNDDPRIWLEGVGRQPIDRDHPQSVGLRTHSGRQQRRRGRGVRRRNRAFASRQRRRRVDPHTVRIHRPLRTETELWPRAGLSALADGSAGASRPVGANCRGCGADADRAVRLPIIAIPTLSHPKTGITSTASKTGCAGGVSPTARRSAMPGRSRDRRSGGRGSAAIRGAWRRGGGDRRDFFFAREAIFTLWAAGAAILLGAYPADKRALVDPGLVATAAEGERISAVDYLRADLVRTALGQQMAAFHQKYDLLPTPTMPIPALPVGQDPE